LTEFVSRVTFSAAFKNSLIDAGGKGEAPVYLLGERHDLYHD